MLRGRLKEEVGQAPNKLQKLNHLQVIEFERTMQALICNSHLAQVKRSTDHPIGQVH